jgi:hypothetical protein
MLTFIDAHSQADEQQDLDDIYPLMRFEGVTRTILAARGHRTSGSIANIAAQHPEKIFPALKTKVNGYISNHPQEYADTLAEQLANHDFVAMQELLLFHAEKPGRDVEEVEVFPDDERVNISLAVAAHPDRRWPIVVHIEFAALAPKLPRLVRSVFKAILRRGRGGRCLKNYYLHIKMRFSVMRLYLPRLHPRLFRDVIVRFQDHLRRLLFEIGLEDLLEAHPEHRFVMIHMGQLSSEEVRQLILRHPNIYFMASHTTPSCINASNQPWVSLFEAGESDQDCRLRPDWKGLILAYPKRFIFALDNVWNDHWERDHYRAQINCWRNALAELPDGIADVVASENAKYLWNLGN